jgi:hypothetical protein
VTSAEPLNLPEILRSRLTPDETLLWQGAPNEAEMTRRAWPMAVVGTIGLIVVALWLTAVVVALRAHAAGASTMALTFLLACFPATVFSAVLFLAPVTARTRARRTLYAATDKRVIVMHGPGEFGMDSYPLADIGHVAVKSPGRPISDIAISLPPTPHKNGRTAVLNAVSEPAALVDRIANA